MKILTSRLHTLISTTVLTLGIALGILGGTQLFNLSPPVIKQAEEPQTVEINAIDKFNKFTGSNFTQKAIRPVVQPSLGLNITESTMQDALSIAPPETQKIARSLMAKCVSGTASACTRLGVMATQANPSTFASFRLLALSLACDRGDAVFSCSHYHREQTDSQRQREIRVLLHQRCQAGDERLCAALGSIIETANPLGAERYFRDACTQHSLGFACSFYVDHLFRTKSMTEAEQSALSLCNQGKVGACYRVAMRAFAAPLKTKPRPLLETICVDQLRQSPWHSPACVAIAQIALRTDDVDTSLFAFQAGCRRPSEAEMSQCRTLGSALAKARPAAQPLLREVLREACRRLHIFENPILENPILENQAPENQISNRSTTSGEQATNERAINWLQERACLPAILAQ
jgi:hypothetical protein